MYSYNNKQEDISLSEDGEGLRERLEGEKGGKGDVILFIHNIAIYNVCYVLHITLYKLYIAYTIITFYGYDISYITYIYTHNI